MGVVIDACNPWDWHWEGQNRQISRAHWSADLAEISELHASEKSSLKIQDGWLLRNDT